MHNSQDQGEFSSSRKIRYVPLGDSYTSGEGVSDADRWPNILVGKLSEKEIAIELVENPSVTGFTTQDVIRYELPIFERADPIFATLLIGANDIAVGVNENRYRENIQIILDRMQSVLPNKEKIILITIPDFSKTPRGKQFGNEEELMQEIQRFNTILKEEGDKRHLPVVDIFPISQKVEDDSSLIVADGLHPSSQQYRDWVEIVYPEAYKMLKKYE